jgi:hypothetical protein
LAIKFPRPELLRLRYSASWMRKPNNAKNKIMLYKIIRRGRLFRH